MKTYNSVQEMLDDIDPEFAEEFRRHQNRPLVKLRHWWYLFQLKVRIWIDKLRGKND